MCYNTFLLIIRHKPEHFLCYDWLIFKWIPGSRTKYQAWKEWLPVRETKDSVNKISHGQEHLLGKCKLLNQYKPDGIYWYNGTQAQKWCLNVLVPRHRRTSNKFGLPAVWSTQSHPKLLSYHTPWVKLESIMTQSGAQGCSVIDYRCYQTHAFLCIWLNQVNHTSIIPNFYRLNIRIERVDLNIGQ